MVHGNLVIKATSMYGAKMVEEIVDAVMAQNGDFRTVREIYKDAANPEYLDCLDVLYEVAEAAPSLLEHRRAKRAR